MAKSTRDMTGAAPEALFVVQYESSDEPKTQTVYYRTFCHQSRALRFMDERKKTGAASYFEYTRVEPAENS